MDNVFTLLALSLARRATNATRSLATARRVCVIACLLFAATPTLARGIFAILQLVASFLWKRIRR